MRKKILAKNLKKPFWKFFIEKDIQIIKEGGCHFNNLYSANAISKKLKTFPHTEYRTREFSSIKTIKNKMKIHTDLFNRGHTYKIVKIDRSYPKYIINNLRQFENYLE